MNTTTRTTPLVNATVQVDQRTGTVVAMADHGTAWVRFPDGTENVFAEDALTVMDTEELHARALDEHKAFTYCAAGGHQLRVCLNCASRAHVDELLCKCTGGTTVCHGCPRKP